MRLHPEIVVPVVAIAAIWAVSKFAKGIARQPVPPIPRRLLAAMALALGVTMLLVGARRSMWTEPPQHTLSTSEESLSMRMDAPTIGEVAKELGLGLAIQKMACLAVAGAGLVVASGSLLCLIPKRSNR